MLSKISVRNLELWCVQARTHGLLQLNGRHFDRRPLIHETAQWEMCKYPFLIVEFPIVTIIE